MKNKKGFTLAEVMIVIAIIVILSGATAIGVVSWLNNAKNTAANLEANNGENFENEARESIRKIGGTAGSLQQPTETLQGTNQPTGTQGTQETQGTQGTQATQQTRETKETQATQQTQQSQQSQEQTQASQNNGGGETTVGNVSANLVKQGEKQQGVVSITGEGNTQKVILQNGDGWCDTNAAFTIVKNGNTYTLKMPNSDFRWQMDSNVFPDMWKSPIPDYTLTPERISYLENTWGIKLK